MMDNAPMHSAQHPHEPEIPPVLDGDGRCRICVLTVEHTKALTALETALQKIDNHSTNNHDREWAQKIREALLRPELVRGER